MIKNYYYLIVGILAILFSISHARNGQTLVLPTLNIDIITTDTKTIFFYVWHIITAENMLFGIAFIVMSCRKNLSKVRFTAWLIAVLMIVRLVVIVGGTLLYDASGLKNTLIDSIAIVIYVALILLGIKVKDKQIETTNINRNAT
jgi:hypothetical protein